MTGIITNDTLCIVEAKRGLNVETYENMKDLARGAVYKSYVDFHDPEKHIDWLKSLVKDLEKSYDEDISQSENKDE